MSTIQEFKILVYSYLGHLATLEISPFSHNAELLETTISILSHQLIKRDPDPDDGVWDNYVVRIQLPDYYNHKLRAAQNIVLATIGFTGCAFRNPCVVPEKWVEGRVVLGPESQICDEAVEWKERFAPS